MPVVYVRRLSGLGAAGGAASAENWLTAIGAIQRDAAAAEQIHKQCALFSIVICLKRGAPDAWRVLTVGAAQASLQRGRQCL